MADDQLRMVAEVVDKFSGPLRELQKLLKGVHTEQDAHTREQKKQQEVLDRSLQQNVRTLREGLAPALSSVGLQTTSVAGAISAIVAATANFGGSVRAMSLLSREAGLSVNAIRALEGVAAKFQIAPESIEKGIVSWSTTLQQLKRNVGPVTNWLREQGDEKGGIYSFGEALKHVKTEGEGLDLMFKKLNTIPGAADRRTFLGGLGLPQEWAKMYGEDLPAAMRKWSAEHMKITGETEANAAKWQESWEAMKQSVVNLRDILGSFTLGPLTTAIDKLTTFIQTVKDAKDLNLPGTFQGGPTGGIMKPPPSLKFINPEPGHFPGQMTPGAGGVTPPGKTSGFWNWFPFGGKPKTDEGELPPTSTPRTGELQIPGLSEAWQKDEAKKGIKEGTTEGVVQGLRDYFTDAGAGGASGGGAGGGAQLASLGGGGMAGLAGLPGLGGAGGATGGAGEAVRAGLAGDAMAGTGTAAIRGAGTTKIRSPSGREFSVASEFAPNFQGFINDYENAGGVIGPNSGGLGTRPNPSYHPLGRAIDLNQIARNTRAGGRSLPVAAENALAAKWGLRSGANFRNPDSGHFEANDRARALAAIKEQGGGGAGNSEYLKTQRTRFASELAANPQLRSEFAAMISSEQGGDPTAVAESLMNRMALTGGTLAGGLHSGFYGSRGKWAGVNEIQRRRMTSGIDAALGGSNVIRGATDQGSPGDPNAAWPGGRIVRSGEIYNDWGGGPGGHEGARRFREAQQAQVAGLLQAAEKRGAWGNPKIEGGAKLDVNFRNLPKGTQTWLSTHGVFDEVAVNKGRTMERAAD